MKKTVRLFLITHLFSITVFSQDRDSTSSQPFPLGLIQKIPSAELHETRTLNIYLPAGYSPDSASTYPVIYLLDGSANEDFIHITGIVQFLAMIGTMPRSIVVGIANVDRQRDFTFPTSIEKDRKDFPTTGGSTRFMAFVEKELQPFIQKNYKTSASKMLIGQSLGGLFATEVLLKKPALFDRYMIISPSLWWDNGSLLAGTRELPVKQVVVKTSVYISVGREGKQMEGDAKRLTGLLKTSGGKNLHVDFLSLPKEDHLTILHNSVYRGLELLYPKKKP